jgi:hypothetical protein
MSFGSRCRFVPAIVAALLAAACSSGDLRRTDGGGQGVEREVAKVRMEAPKRCRLERPVGSHVPREVCRTAREAAEDAGNADELMSESRQRATMRRE